MAGKWLEAIPCSQKLSFPMPNFVLRHLIMRLGVALPQLSNIKECVSQCKKVVDDKGYHLLTYKFGGGPLKRHDYFLDRSYDMLQSVDYRCRKELTPQFEEKQRPNHDIAVYNYRDGINLLLDTTITHQSLFQDKSSNSEKAGFAASERRKKRMRNIY